MLERGRRKIERRNKEKGRRRRGEERLAVCMSEAVEAVAYVERKRKRKERRKSFRKNLLIEPV